ncbi:neo-calmodulin-like [Mizuhopecten yessoensis]|uniref:Calmodulin n=1 Tax=Mizuhopecten yessoensis TaxID=6573 RepID=A0A210PEP6_MIZYE|nr:neo-calmodulin-like [Mizuhopecten yessoensis]XP_021343472.1 neo-calmodulin-like [Mizuhopecten yessoensis]XP_021343473.1 neo-calmodulin-like [Mizuhopecten yessoensis]OWF34955.1 Calmodulin [Mizuhopecten yessoensis]
MNFGRRRKEDQPNQQASSQKEQQSPGSKKMREEIKRTFELFDKDKNGKITESELTDVMRALGQNPTTQHVRSIIAEVDKDNDGEIDFEEFVSMMSKKWRDLEKEEDEIKKAFKVFDRNGDGMIEMRELKAVLTGLGERMTEEEFQDLMREADLDGNGVITYEEFSSVLANKFI